MVPGSLYILVRLIKNACEEDEKRKEKKKGGLSSI